jgi:hypothetical protein
LIRIRKDNISGREDKLKIEESNYDNYEKKLRGKMNGAIIFYNSNVYVNI